MKKIFLFIFCIFFFFAQNFGVIAAKIEDVFSDIGTDYPYYNELQTLYDKGMFSPDVNGNFSPDTYLTREEFIGIVSEISCKTCIKPEVSPEYIQKYYNYKNFFDVKKDNKYFYCIAGAKDNNNISGYSVGHICENGKGLVGSVPFCPKNTIVLEEALAILLRTSNILQANDAEIIRANIRSGKEYPVLANDVQPKNNGYVYSFYPDFYKALDISITEYDTQGNKKLYALLEKKGDFLFPKKAITKEEFLQMAYVVMKGNSCIENKNNDIGANIQIFDKECSEQKQKGCRISQLNKGEKIYDFHAKVAKEYPSSDLKFTWRIYDFSDGSEIIQEGRYIDNYDFIKKGKYRIYLIVSNTNGKYSEVYNDIVIGKGILGDIGFINNMKSSIQANPLSGTSPLRVDFSGIVYSGNGIREYTWDFGDGHEKKGIKTSHIFKEPGNYTVKFSVTDSRGSKSTATTVIEVTNNNKDTDGDGVIDSEDYEKQTPKDKVAFICTTQDIKLGLYGCIETDLGVYNPDKEKQEGVVDTDGDGVKDYLDEEKNTDPDKIDTICTNTDIQLARFGCKDGDLGVANPRNNDSSTPDLGVQIQVYEKACSKEIQNCTVSKFPKGVTVFDFAGETTLSTLERSRATYKWVIMNTKTTATQTIYKEYLNDYDFLEIGEYDVVLTVTSSKGDTATAKTHISIIDSQEANNLSIAIAASPLETTPNSWVDFRSVIGSKLPTSTITWDFGDNTTSDGKTTRHKYIYEGTYTVAAEVSDSFGNTARSELVVYIHNTVIDTDGDGVNDNEDKQIKTPASQVDFICTKDDVNNNRYGCSRKDLGVYNPEKDRSADTDEDGIVDVIDQCPTVKGKRKNMGCPIYESECTKKADCPEGYYCDGSYCKLQIIERNCEYTGRSLLLGNTVCTSCPCDYRVDFRSNIRACDIVFPAITSPNEKSIYSKGNYYQIQKTLP